MTIGFTDRLLNVAFRFAKIISVVLAGVLVLVFLVGIGWSIKKTLSGGGMEDVRFDKVFNEMQAGMTESDSPGASTGAGIVISNEVRTQFGKDVGRAMTDARCSTPQFERTMNYLVQIANDDDKAPYLGDMAKGAIRWFDDAAAFQKSSSNAANADWYCGDGYWSEAGKNLAEAAGKRQARSAEIMQGFGLALMTLLAAFILMVIPAIYRIEESLRQRPL